MAQNVAAPAWNEYMKFATTGRSHVAFPALKATDTTKPILKRCVACCSLNALLGDKSDPRGAVPTAAQRDPQYSVWESAVQSWVANHPVFSVQFETNKTQMDSILAQSYDSDAREWNFYIRFTYNYPTSDSEFRTYDKRA